MPEIKIDTYDESKLISLPETYIPTPNDVRFISSWIDFLGFQIKHGLSGNNEVENILNVFQYDVVLIINHEKVEIFSKDNEKISCSEELGQALNQYCVQPMLFEFIEIGQIHQLQINLKWLYSALKLQGGNKMGVNGLEQFTGEGDAFTSALNFHNKDKDVGEQIKPLPESKGEYMKYVNECIAPTYKTKGKRPSKDEYYLKMAENAASRGTCLRRSFGAIIVNHDEIVATGYVGAPRGRKNCCDIGYCWREAHNIQSGQMYEKCRSMHAEMNACVSAGREKSIGGTMYLVGIENDKSYTEADCCSMCKRVIINAGLKTVVFRTKDGGIRKVDVQEWIDNDDSLIEHEGY